MNLKEIRENKLKKILGFSIPAIIAMVLTSMITIVDGYFIGNNVGSEGIAAVNLGLPITYLFIAIGLMLGVGGMVIAGIAYGEGELKTCNDVFNQTITVTTVVSIVLSIIVFICFKPLLTLLNANDIVSGYFIEYYTIMLIVFPMIIVNSVFGMFIRGEGRPQIYMVINIITVVLNFILDYVFTRVIEFGIFGVAISSLVATFISLLVSVIYFIKRSNVYKFSKFKFSKEVLKQTIFNGSSEFIGEMSMCISMFAYNLVLMRKVGVDGVTAFTIVGYIAFIFSMIIIGFGQGVSPLISFVFGAKDNNTAKELRKITNKIVLLVGVIIFVIMLLSLHWYSRIFVDNIFVQEMIRSGMIIFIISFLFSGINTISSFYFTSIGRAKESAIISFSRGFLVLLISIFILPELFGIMGIWLAAPVTEVITLMITIYFINMEKKKYCKL